MQSATSQTIERRNTQKESVETLPVVRNFRQVIEARDMSLMNGELYQFLNLYCGFIAHYNIHGFRETYASPGEFAHVFMRHFDRGHGYFCGNYACHEEPYQDTGFTKAEIKEEFFRIVDQHKEDIGRWAEAVHRARRFAVYQSLKREFEGEKRQLHLECEGCGKNMDIRVEEKGGDKAAPDQVCCRFCGHAIKINENRR